MLESALQEINTVHGVIGSFVCLNDGSLVAQVVPKSIMSAQIAAAASVVAQTVQAIDTLEHQVLDADLLYENAHVVWKNMGGGLLVILCQRSINVQLLNLKTDGIAKKIKAELASVAKPAEKQPAAPPASPVAAGTPLPPLVDGKFFDRLAQELARIMGATAPILIEEEISAMQETGTQFPKARVTELIDRICAAIPNETKSARFRQAMLEAIRQM